MEFDASMQAAAVFCGFAATGWLLLVGMRFSGTAQPPAWLAIAHGLLAATGLTLLIYAAMTDGFPSMVLLGTALFMLTALAGASMNLLFHWKRAPLPVRLTVVHASAAVSGFVLILLSLHELQPRF